MTAIETRRYRIPDGAYVWVVVGLAWSLYLLVVLTGRDALLEHDAILEQHAVPSFATLLLFLAAWQFMTAAMMLPSSLPMIRVFRHASRGQSRPRLVQATFLAAYFIVWTGFAVIALSSDAGIHQMVDRWSWLSRHEYVIGAALLMTAGAFQFSSLKETCLTACRSPLSFLWRFYDRGVRPAWMLGIRHGVFCLGCCWALMLVMFGVGVGSLPWMIALTGVMVAEKTTRIGYRLVPVFGAGMIGLGLLALVMPGVV